MKIGIQFATPGELFAFPGIRDLQPISCVSGIDFYEPAPDILVCAGGIGKVNAAMCTEIYCLHFGVDMVITSGVAGCTEDYPIGTLVVPTAFIQHDMDTSAIGDPVGLVSTVNQIEFPTDNPVLIQALLKELGIDSILGTCATGDWFAVRCARSEWIRDTFHPLLMEMEGCAVAQVCLRNNVKFVSIKSVSDRIFHENNADEYFDFEETMKGLGAIILPLAKKLQEVK